MFLHTLIETKEVDLDAILNSLKTDDAIVNNMISNLGSLEYGFVIYCVEQQINAIKKAQEEEETPSLPDPPEDPNDPCGCIGKDPCEGLSSKYFD